MGFSRASTFWLPYSSQNAPPICRCRGLGLVDLCFVRYTKGSSALKATPRFPYSLKLVGTHPQPEPRYGVSLLEHQHTLPHHAMPCPAIAAILADAADGCTSLPSNQARSRSSWRSRSGWPAPPWHEGMASICVKASKQATKKAAASSRYCTVRNSPNPLYNLPHSVMCHMAFKVGNAG